MIVKAYIMTNEPIKKAHAQTHTTIEIETIWSTLDCDANEQTGII